MKEKKIKNKKNLTDRCEWQRQRRRFNGNGNGNGGCSSVFLLQRFNGNGDASTAMATETVHRYFFRNASTAMATATATLQWQRQRRWQQFGFIGIFFFLGFSLFFFERGILSFLFCWMGDSFLFGSIYSGILAMKCFRL